MEVNVNYLAVLLGAIASMIVGFVYYNPSVAGKAWMKETGYKPDALKKEQKEMGKYYGLSFVLALLTAYVLTHVMVFSMNFYNYPPVTTGVMSAFYMWLGFVLPVQATDQIFGKKNFKLLAINSGYQLLALLAMGLVIGFLN